MKNQEVMILIAKIVAIILSIISPKAALIIGIVLLLAVYAALRG